MPSEPQVPARVTVRVPFEAEVVVEFDRFSGFLEEYSSNLSLGGMFITTRYLKPVGSELNFELRLKDAAPLVRGRGMVAWTRWQDQGARRPAGMGVRFLDLDPDSRELIYRIVDERLRSGEVSEELALDAAALAEISAPPSVESLAGPAIPELPAALADLPPPAPVAAPPATPSASAGPPIPFPSLAQPSPLREREFTPLDRAVASLAQGAAAEREAPSPAGETDSEPPAFTDGVPFATVSADPPPGISVERSSDPPSPPEAVPPLEEIVARAEGRPLPAHAAAPPTSISRLPIPPRAAAPPASASSGRARPRSGSPWPAVAGVGLLLALAAGGWLLWRRTQPVQANLAGPARVEPASTVPSQAAPQPATAPPAAPESPSVAVPAAPAPAPASAPSPAARRFAELEKITWEEADGSTELVLWLDGAIPDGSFDHARIDGKEPRELVRLRGASGPVAAGRTEVGTPEVRRVRTGMHGSDLHVVVDLAAGARLVEARADGDTLRLRVLFR